MRVLSIHLVSLFHLWLLCPFSWAENADECRRLYRITSQEGSTPPPVDVAALREWLRLQLPENRSIADLLARKYEYISANEFKRKAVLAAEDLVKDVPLNKIVLVHDNSGTAHGYKSSSWVIGLLQESIPALRNVPVAASRQMEKESGCMAPPCVYVFVDDAAYSGAQMRHSVSRLATDLVSQKKGGTKIAVLVPFITDRAEKALKSAYNESYHARHFQGTAPSTLRIYSAKKIKTIHELALEEGVKIPESMDFDRDRTITFFQHKIPDFLSFSPIFRDGIVKGSRITVPFLPEIRPPYRRPRLSE